MLSKAFRRSLIPVGLGGLMLAGCTTMPEPSIEDVAPRTDDIAAIIDQGAPTNSVSGASPTLSAPWLKLGDYTSRPLGHVEFCQRLPAECSFTSKKPVFTQLDEEAWSQLVKVNADVNSQYKPRTDQQIYNEDEYWTFPLNNADCEDYVLEKRKRLMAEGWNPASLLITVVKQPDGEGHAILTVRTDRGDFALDNMRSEILPWNETGYTFIKTVSPRSANSWQTVIGNDNQGPDARLVEHVGRPVLRPAFN